MPAPIIHSITPVPNENGDKITITGENFFYWDRDYVATLSAAWGFDGNLTDESGNGHTLTAVGGTPTYVPGLLQSAISLDGATYLDSDLTYVDILCASPHLGSTNSGFSISLYFNPSTSSDSTCACLFSIGDDTPGINETLALYYNTSGGLTLEYTDSLKTSSVSTTIAGKNGICGISSII